MAELGVAAACLQLLELFSKIVIHASKLAKQLKDAPDEIRRHAQSLESFCNLHNAYKQTLQKTSASTDVHIQSEDYNHIQNLLTKSKEKLASLEEILTKLYPVDTDRRPDFWKKAFKEIRDEKKILSHLEELRELRDQIEALFSQNIWGLMVNLSEKTQTSFTELQHGQSRTEDGLAVLRQGQRENARAMAGLETSIASLQISSQTAIRHTGESIAEQINSSLADVTLSDESISRLAVQIREQTSVQPEQSVIISKRPMIGSSPVCLCLRFGNRERLISIGQVDIVVQRLGEHRPGCMYHGRSEGARVERRLLVVPNGKHEHHWTASLIRFMVTATSFLMGGLNFPNISDDSDIKAPGFRHFMAADWDIKKTLNNMWWSSELAPRRKVILPEELRKCRRVLEKLYQNLSDDFNTTRDWARIQTNTGKTLFHALVELLMELWPVQEEVSDLVALIVRLLIEGGTSTDCTMRGHSWWSGDISGRVKVCYNYDTALSLCISALREADIPSKGSTLFLQLLSEQNISSFSTRSSTPSGWLIPRLFVVVPDLAIEYGCSRLCLTVIERDQYELERLLKSRMKVDTPEHVSALSFAVEWPAGVKVLLEKGADPSQAVKYAIGYSALESLKLLLGADINIFEPGGAASAREYLQHLPPIPNFVHSLVDLGLWRSRIQSNFDQRILSVLIDALSASRSELMRVAKENLSVSQLEDLGWELQNTAQDHHYLIDSAALPIFHKLKNKDVQLPKRLWPGTAKTVYHNVFMTADVAELLWEHGFKEIDEIDANGVTPLFLNTRDSLVGPWYRIPKILVWFLRHGAKTMVFPRLNNNTFIHKLAANLGAMWSKDSAGINQITKQWLPIILEKTAVLLPAQPRDLCRCFCSPEGCSPIQSLVKHMSHEGKNWTSVDSKTYTWWTEKRGLFKLWEDCCPRTKNRSSDFAELCRIELFERLGMRHTCCKFICQHTHFISEELWMEYFMGRDFCMPDALEVAEFQGEDKFYNEKLGRLMLLYDELAKEYADKFIEFWDTWWIVLEDFIPPEVFSNELGDRGRGLRVDHISLPLPTETLNEDLEKIRNHVSRSMSKGVTRRA